MSGLETVFREGFARRLVGPGHLRIIIQPLVAIILGVRDGLMDARAGNPPYLISFFSHQGSPREVLIQNLDHIWKPFLVGVILDAVLQYFIFQRVSVLGAILAGFVLIGLPYSAARGLTNRIYTSSVRYRGHRGRIAPTGT